MSKTAVCDTTILLVKLEEGARAAMRTMLLTQGDTGLAMTDAEALDEGRAA